MAGERDLDKLLASLSPRLVDDDFVFCTIEGAAYGDFADLSPLASFSEDDGLTLVLTKQKADRAGLKYESLFRCITLDLHSSLAAVGLTAAVSRRLADRGISANIIAAYHHDHVFVPAEKAGDALSVLNEFSRRHAEKLQ